MGARAALVPYAVLVLMLLTHVVVLVSYPMNVIQMAKIAVQDFINIIIFSCARLG